MTGRISGRSGAYRATGPNPSRNSSRARSTFATGFDDVGSRGRSSKIDAKALKAEWTKDFVQAEIPYEAMRKSSQLFDKTVKDIEKATGFTVDPKTRHEIAVAISLPYQAVVEGELKADPALGDRFLAKHLKAHQAYTAGKKDPFQLILDKDPVQLRKEIVLYQDKDFLVVVDTFAKGPKALVVPVKKSVTPDQMSDAQFAKYAALSSKVGDALQKATGWGAPVAWINPPQRMTLGRMHVHVSVKPPRGTDPRFAPRIDLNQVYQEVIDELNP